MHCAQDTTVPTKKFSLVSPEFIHYAPIAERFSCKGKNISPELAWSNVPSTTQSFALLVEDPDAPRGTWIHWVVYNLPKNLMGLPEHVNVKKIGGLEGINSSGKNRYDGPCPPSGTHRYFFKLYALDALLALERGATKEQLLAAMQGHVVAQAELVGTFSQ